MKKCTTSDLKPGDRILLPIGHGGTEIVTVRITHPYTPGIRETSALAAQHNRIVYFEREARGGRGVGFDDCITTRADQAWQYA